MYRKFIKRILDIVFSLLLLIVFSPIFLVLMLLVKIKLGSPIFFIQERPGKNGKIFNLYKFRTMTEKKDENGNLISDEERITPFGKLLRSTSLDELPELYNILKGEMSFVGPRPLLVEYLEFYNEKQKHRHDVKPGLTGLAQVTGRNLLSWEERFDLDVKYVEEMNFLLDIKILFKTIAVVLKRVGISSATSQTMEKFTGTEK